jgi:anaerobic magnesium-protoporphyrin IX monomethyl ester cyclase
VPRLARKILGRAPVRASTRSEASPNLLATTEDDADAVESWRQELESHGVWANKPVPLFPYPGSPEYTRMWGATDDLAWERAHEFYLKGFDSFSDIQEQRPQALVELELASHGR